MSERENTPTTPHHQESASRAAERGADDRTNAVRPQDNPAPRSPSADRDAVQKGEEILERVKPY